MTVAHRLLVLAILLLPAGTAAQTIPWPGVPAASAPAATPWPNDAPGEGSPARGIFPMTGAQRPDSGPPCMAEFTKLREEVEKRGQAAKAAGAGHVARDDMCTYVTIYAAAEARWVKFTEAGVQNCGIPIQVVNQLKQVHANTEQTREKICTWPRTNPLVGDFDFGVAIPRPSPQRLNEILRWNQKSLEAVKN